jgi:hypothetical protein
MPRKEATPSVPKKFQRTHAKRVFVASDGAANRSDVNPNLPPALDAHGISVMPSGSGKDALVDGLADAGIAENVERTTHGDTSAIEGYGARSTAQARSDFERLPNPNRHDADNRLPRIPHDTRSISVIAHDAAILREATSALHAAGIVDAPRDSLSGIAATPDSIQAALAAAFGRR